MKIYFFNLKKVIRYVIAFIIIVSVLSTSGILLSRTINVFGTGSQLPIYSVDYSEKKVAITFDCAWGAEDIPDILKALKNENVKATFFIIGQWAEKYPDVVKLIVSEGHDIANHSYSHPKMGSLSPTNVKEEIIKCNQVLEKLSGKKVELFRAPYGDYNDTVIEEVNNLQSYPIQWDVEGIYTKVKI